LEDRTVYGSKLQLILGSEEFVVVHVRLSLGVNVRCMHDGLVFVFRYRFELRFGFGQKIRYSRDVS
jgi:hypothetical protein